MLFRKPGARRFTDQAILRPDDGSARQADDHLTADTGRLWIDSVQVNVPGRAQVRQTRPPA
jgi:hypothetical protein